MDIPILNMYEQSAILEKLKLFNIGGSVIVSGNVTSIFNS